MKSVLSRFSFFIKNRFVIFSIFCIIFIVSHRIAFHVWMPSTETKDLWFYSGIFMVLFSILFIEPYYSSPKNVITNTIPLLLVFLSIKTSFDNNIFWWSAVITLILLLIGSITALNIEDKERSLDHWRNQLAAILKDIVVVFGQGKVLYSSVFIYFLLTYHSIQDFYTLTMFILWAVILLINPKSIHGSFAFSGKKKHKDQVGEIFGVQSKKIFLAKLYDDRKSIKKFNLVRFDYSMQDSAGFVIVGIVFDTYLLNQEKWAKILQLKIDTNENTDLEKNIVYLVSEKKEINDIAGDLRIDKLVGIVIEGSTIGKIKFEYSKKVDDLQEGDLLELNIGKRRLFYQVISGSTEIEKLEARNETGFIEGEAIQLGEWQDEALSFQKFGWVPSINTPIFKTDASDIKSSEIAYPNYELGIVPNTQLPSIINLNDAVSHHLALLGVTGSGKSFLAREIIDQIKSDTKVICVDFNREFALKLVPAPPNIITNEAAKYVSDRIEWISNELEKYPNQQDKFTISVKQNEIKVSLRREIESFISDKSSSIRVFELPDVTNTSAILDYTKYFFKTLFEIAKEKQISGDAIKMCIVLEEAHTIVPEWNFSGVTDRSSQGLVNSIGQIALQGRKYGVGFLVIAQRTANVSKTILTQCNTVVCFQAFDETSFSFLSNYVGKDMIYALPNLKQYHAVVAGKAMKANIPMIIDLKR